MPWFLNAGRLRVTTEICLGACIHETAYARGMVEIAGIGFLEGVLDALESELAQLESHLLLGVAPLKLLDDVRPF